MSLRRAAAQGGSTGPRLAVQAAAVAAADLLLLGTGGDAAGTPIATPCPCCTVPWLREAGELAGNAAQSWRGERHGRGRALGCAIASPDSPVRVQDECSWFHLCSAAAPCFGRSGATRPLLQRCSIHRNSTTLDQLLATSPFGAHLAQRVVVSLLFPPLLPRTRPVHSPASPTNNAAAAAALGSTAAGGERRQQQAAAAAATAAGAGSSRGSATTGHQASQDSGRAAGLRQPASGGLCRGAARPQRVCPAGGCCLPSWAPAFVKQHALPFAGQCSCIAVPPHGAST